MENKDLRRLVSTMRYGHKEMGESRRVESVVARPRRRLDSYHELIITGIPLFEDQHCPLPEAIVDSLSRGVIEDVVVYPAQY